ncbi:uncharacterized protein LOC124311187 isoform X3 [Daphnia pulicaria]|uniref:uncharacterized protein LOC124311187 isoform X3 n=1 Tax=Daphnia pulicaria TaxID=35523 RepID=UPI001EEBB662|nr:uncharacterized protein LOC124311187 isoform X3 [Daphnia pulicaria]
MSATETRNICYTAGGLREKGGPLASGRPPTLGPRESCETWCQSFCTGSAAETTTMSDEEESQELVMIAEKARSLLNRNERQVLSHCCHSYLSGRMGVHHFVDALLRLLPTPDKVERGAVAPLLSGDGATGDHHYHHHPFYHNYQLLSQGNSPNCSPDIRESIRAAKSLQAMDFDSPCDVIGTTIQPVPLAASAQPFRGGLKETNIIPMMTIDLKTAFPTSSSSSAFKPLAATSNHVTKESFGGQKNVAAPTTTVPKQWPTNKTTTAEAPPAPAAGRRTGCRLPVSDDEPTEVVIRKSKKILGVAIEGGINTRHPLPRIITIDGKGTAFEAAGLRIGQTIISVDGRPMQGLTHEEAARIIANSYADRSVPELKLLMSPSTFRPNANYQPEN